MNFISLPDEQLAAVRFDPLLVEQELDVRPEFAEAVERAAGLRSGRVYWRSADHDHLYALELGDLGRGRPSTATVFGLWDRYEPRPPEHEIDGDLLAFNLWIAGIGGGTNPADVASVARFAGIKPEWPEGSVLRTPESRFASLPGYAYEPKYVDIEGLRMAYVEHGSGDPILCVHGEPTWGYLYRHMIPILAERGRVIVPDLIGFGRSDKPAADNAYTVRSHARWLRKFVAALGLERATLVCQDWGGSLGLRVLADMPERFAKLVAMNTGIAAGTSATPAFLKWRRFSQRVESLDVAKLMAKSLTRRKLSEAEFAAYNAPYPSVDYQTAALVFPRLVPTRRDTPGALENRSAIARLAALDLPVQLIWGGADAVTLPARDGLAKLFRNVTLVTTLEGVGHFIQEDAGEEAARLIVA